MTSVVVVEQEVLVQVETGFQGPQGIPGSPGSGYVHTQLSASDNWTVNHNLGVRPAVTVVDTGGNEIDAAVRHVSANQVVLTFTEPVAGFARLV